MWHNLESFACSELDSSTDAIHTNYQKLSEATMELQRRVKELMSEYTADGAPGAEATAPSFAADGKGSDLAATLGHTERLLSQLCAQRPRIDDGPGPSAPGTIFTPRAAPRDDLAARDAGMSLLAGSNNLTPLLAADIPCLRWGHPGETAWTARPTSAAALRPAQVSGPGGVRGGTGQRLAPKLHVALDAEGPPDDPLRAVQDFCEDLRLEVLSELRELQPSASGPAEGGAKRGIGGAGVRAADPGGDLPLAVHRVMLRDALQLDCLPPQGGAHWGRPRVREEEQARIRELVAAVFHTSRSSADAWAAVTQVLMHPWAQPDHVGARMLGAGARAEAEPGVEAGAEAGATRTGGYQQQQQQPLPTPDCFAETLATMRADGECWLQECNQRREVAFPVAPPGRLSAQQLASFHVDILPGSYLQLVAQVLLHHAALQVPALADLPERVPSWTVRTLYGGPFGDAVKLAVLHALAESSGEGRLAQGGGLKQDGGASDAAEAAVQRAQAALVRLSHVFRDVTAFESCLAALLAPRGIEPSLVRRRPDPATLDTTKAERGDTTPSELLRREPAVLPPESAAAFTAVVREEVARGLREARPQLQGHVFGHLTTAVRVCLSSASSDEMPLVEVSVTPVLWPQRPGGIRGNGKDANADGAESPGSWGASGEEPQRVDLPSQRVLQLVAWLQGRLQEYPGAVQAVLLGAILECLSALMDRLSTICTTPRDLPYDPLPRMLLFHAAACCVRGRLDCLPTNCLLSAEVPHDEHCLALVQQHGQCLVQADELVSNIHRHIVAAHMDIVRTVVLSCVDRTDWGAYRPEVMRGQSAGPALRVWQALLLRMAHTAVRIGSLDAAEWIVGQVLLDSVASLAVRYLRICCSVQQLREFVADLVHVAATICVLCQPLPVRRVSAGVVRLQPGERHGGASDGKGSRWLRIPYDMVSALAGTTRELLIRAALLHASGARLAEVTRAVSLMTPPNPASATEAAAAAAATAHTSEPTAPPSPAPQSMSVAMAAAAGSTHGNQVVNGVSGRGRSALPAINLCRTSLSSEGRAADPAAAVADPLRRSLQPSADGTGRRSQHSQRNRVAVTAATEPFGSPLGGSNGASGAEGGLPTDEDRLTLWSSWLPHDIVRRLRAEAAMLELGGEAVATRLMPLGDRMADKPAPGDAGDGMEAEGAAWRRCLDGLLGAASGEQVLLALARRHELFPAVGNEPEGNAESRRVVRGMAQQLGLLRESHST